ncbi:MAG: type II toxin-antitoxin system Phd/YefM family antitoxin [Acetobacteraceae bacterium]
MESDRRAVQGICSDEMALLDALTADVTRTVSVTQFKSQCVDLLDLLASREITRVAITRRGRVIGVLTPPDAVAGWVSRFYARGRSAKDPESVDRPASRPAHRKEPALTA